MAFGERDACRASGRFMAVQSGEHRQDFLDGCQDMGLGPAQRRQTSGRQPRLEIADVVVAKLEVVDEILGRTAVGWVGFGDVTGSCGFGGQHRVSNGADVCLEGLECVAFKRCGLHCNRLRKPSERWLNRA